MASSYRVASSSKKLYDWRQVVWNFCDGWSGSLLPTAKVMLDGSQCIFSMVVTLLLPSLRPVVTCGAEQLLAALTSVGSTYVLSLLASRSADGKSLVLL